MYLNIRIGETERDLDLYLNDEDKIRIVYCLSGCNEDDSTPEVTFRELFDLISDNKNAKSLSNYLNVEQTKNKKLEKENKSLMNELSVLKSAIDIIKKD